MRVRAGAGQWTGEFAATFGLVLTILLVLRHRPRAIPAGIALYIISAYWLTSSKSFTDPVISVAHSYSHTFAGIAPSGVPAFIAAHLIGALAAVLAPKATGSA